MGAALNAESLYGALQAHFGLRAKGAFTLADVLEALLNQDPERERSPSAQDSDIPDGYAETLQAALQAFVDAQPWRANGSIEDVTLPYTEGDEPESARLARELEL